MQEQEREIKELEKYDWKGIEWLRDFYIEFITISNPKFNSFK